MAPNQSLCELSARLLSEMNSYFLAEKPDMVIAQGDTTTTMIASLVSFYLKIPFAHVEAGLRSHDIYSPFPEEFNRQCAGKLAALHFAPTESAKQNLLAEGIDKQTIYVTGNTIIDTLRHFTKQAEKNKFTHFAEKVILVTCHRRENFGENLQNICHALKEIIDQHKNVAIIFPVHPNPNIKETVYNLLQGVERVHLYEPFDYQTMVSAMLDCYLILTDSGGLQEEAPALAKPVLVMRTETERPEAVECGASRLVGVEHQSIVQAVNELLSMPDSYQRMSQAGSPYGDGHASEYIVNLISTYFKL